MTTDEPRIDAHAHVFHRGLTLAAGRRYTPGYDAPLRRYLRQLDRHGMSHGVLVQPSFLGTDNSYLVGCLRQARGRLRGVAVVDPAVPHDDLLRLRKAGVAGIRLNLVGRPVPDLASARWTLLLAKVRGLGWHVEVQRPASGLASIVATLLGAGLPVVVDHFGLPDGGASDPGFRGLLSLGKSGRVWVKLSAPYRMAPNGRAMSRQLYPWLRDAFGLQRLMWGSDWPHTQFEGTQTYGRSCRNLPEMTRSVTDAAAVLASPRVLFGL